MPLPVISIAQMRDWEKATWATGRTEKEVIRLVGRAIAETALKLTRAQDRIVILAGKGNNGQDALYSREHLVERSVDVLEVVDPAGDIRKLKGLLTEGTSLVIDGLFGIGLSRPLNREWIGFIEAVNAARLRVLAVDVPSGLNAGTGRPEGAAVKAELTLTVGAPKAGMLCESAWDYVGRLEVAADVGLASPPEGGDLHWTVAGDFAGYPPSRAVASHKGTYGHLAIVAGSRGYHGAAVLASRGAQRAQPGLITLHTLESVYPVVASQLQAVMVSTWHRQTDLERSWTAVLAGPGLASVEVPDELKRSIGRLWREAEAPVVVDASALEWLPPGSVREGALRVITPHPGEAARLLGSTSRQVQANRLQSLRDLSQRFGDCWVVLKGHQTLVGCARGTAYVNPSGNPYLAQGGSGDLLSGYIAGLLAQPALREDPLTAVRYAVWRHGHSADLLQSTRGHWVVEDLANNLGAPD